jgi:hypothetical protein
MNRRPRLGIAAALLCVSISPSQSQTGDPLILPAASAAPEENGEWHMPGKNFGGKVIVGNSGGELGVRGWVQALDAATGETLWKAYSTGPMPMC